MATTTDDIIDRIIFSETGGDPNGGYTNDPEDAGGRTIWGISERANPDLWVNGPPTRAQAVERYIQRYVKAPRFDKVLDPHLQAQLVDFGVTSGPKVAIQKLQLALGAKVDGILGPETLSKVNNHPNQAHINNILVAERIKMLGRLVQKRPSDLKFLSGWLNRSLDFLR